MADYLPAISGGLKRSGTKTVLSDKATTDLLISVYIPVNKVFKPIFNAHLWLVTNENFRSVNIGAGFINIARLHIDVLFYGLDTEQMLQSLNEIVQPDGFVVAKIEYPVGYFQLGGWCLAYGST